MTVENWPSPMSCLKNSFATKPKQKKTSKSHSTRNFAYASISPTPCLILTSHQEVKIRCIVWNRNIYTDYTASVWGHRPSGPKNKVWDITVAETRNLLLSAWHHGLEYLHSKTNSLERVSLHIASRFFGYPTGNGVNPVTRSIPHMKFKWSDGAILRSDLLQPSCGWKPKRSKPFLGTWGTWQLDRFFGIRYTPEV